MMHLGKSNIWWQLYQRKLTDHDPSFLDTVSATIHGKIQNSGARNPQNTRAKDIVVYHTGPTTTTENWS